MRKEIHMKRSLIAGVAAFAVMAGAQALAQTTVIQLEPEQRTKIKEYVVKQKVKPIAMKERVTVGATLPASVTLAPVPADWGPSVTRYRYVYSDDNVMLVDPSSRKVVEIID
jgi:hypothetical protein